MATTTPGGSGRDDASPTAAPIDSMGGGATSEASLMGGQGDHAPFMVRVKHSAFGVFHVMTEMRKVSTLTQILAVIFTLFDQLQMVQTSLESVYPWDQSVMEMLRRFNIGPLLFPDPTPTVFGLAFAATVGMVWLSFIDAIYVGYAFHTNRVGSVWPLHILRAAVSVIITAGFRPFLTIISTPLRCTLMQYYFQGDFQCGGAVHSVLIAVAVITLGVFLPCTIAASLVFHFSNPDSQSLLAKTSGRPQFRYTLGRTLIIVGVRFGGSIAQWTSLASIVVYLVTLWEVNVSLYFRHHSMNRLLSGTFGVNLWMAAGAGIVSWSTGWGAPPISTFVLTVVWLVGTIPVGVAASYLPNIRRSKLIDIIHQYQHMLLSAYSNPSSKTKHKNRISAHRRSVLLPSSFQAAVKRKEAQAGSEDTGGGGGGGGHKARRVNQARRGSTTPSHGGQPRVKGDGDDTDDEYDDVFLIPGVPIEKACSALFRHSWMRPTDVEVMARYVIELYPSRRRGVSARTRPPPSKRAMRAARRIYIAGLVEWPTNVVVKLAYARFLWCYCSDSVGANEFMRGLSSPPPGLDIQFFVFSWLRMLAQLRQSEHLGEATMNMIVLLEFRKNFERALQHHHGAVRLLLKMWALLVTNSLTEEIKTTISAVLDQSKLANQSYQRLVHQYPEATLVLRLYSSFVKDVLNDAEFAAGLVQRAERLEGLLDDGTHVGDDGPSGSHPDSDRAAAGTPSAEARRRSSIVNASTPANTKQGQMRAQGLLVPVQRRRKTSQLRTDVTMLVARVHSQLRFGVLALLALALASFITARVLEHSYVSGVDSVASSASRRTLAIDAVYAARGMQLDATEAEAAGAGADAIAAFDAGRREALRLGEALRSSTVELFFSHDSFDAIQEFTNTPQVPMEVKSETGSSFVEDTYNLWDAAMFYVAALGRVAGSAPATMTATAAVSVDWAFVVRNGMSTLQESFDAATSLYIVHIGDVFRIAVIVQSALLVLVFVTELILGFGVVRKALKKVRASNRGVLDVAKCIPLKCRIAMLTRYQRINEEMEEMASEGLMSLPTSSTAEEETAEDGTTKPTAARPQVLSLVQTMWQRRALGRQGGFAASVMAAAGPGKAGGFLGAGAGAGAGAGSGAGAGAGAGVGVMRAAGFGAAVRNASIGGKKPAATGFAAMLARTREANQKAARKELEAQKQREEEAEAARLKKKNERKMGRPSITFEVPPPITTSNNTSDAVVDHDQAQLDSDSADESSTAAPSPAPSPAPAPAPAPAPSPASAVGKASQVEQGERTPLRAATPTAEEAAAAQQQSKPKELASLPSEGLLPGFTSSFVRNTVSSATAADSMADDPLGDAAELYRVGVVSDSDSSDNEGEDGGDGDGRSKSSKRVRNMVLDEDVPSEPTAAIPSGREMVAGRPVSMLERALSRHAMTLLNISQRPLPIMTVPKDVDEMVFGAGGEAVHNPLSGGTPAPISEGDGEEDEDEEEDEDGAAAEGKRGSEKEGSGQTVGGDSSARTTTSTEASGAGAGQASLSSQPSRTPPPQQPKAGSGGGTGGSDGLKAATPSGGRVKLDPLQSNVQAVAAATAFLTAAADVKKTTPAPAKPKKRKTASTWGRVLAKRGSASEHQGPRLTDIMMGMARQVQTQPHEAAEDEDAKARFRRVARLARMLKDPTESVQNKLSPMQRRLLIQVSVTLVFMACLHIAAYAVRIGAVVNNLPSAVEVNEAERCVALAAEMRTLSRELRIGDAWVSVHGDNERFPDPGPPPTQEGLKLQLQRLQQVTDALLSIRFGLRFGNDTMGLPGAATRDAGQVALQTGGSQGDATGLPSSASVTAGGSSYESSAAALHGGDAVVHLLSRRVRALMLVANSSSDIAEAPVGVDPVALDNDALLASITSLEEAQVSPLLRRTTALFVSELSSRIDVSETIDYVVSGVNVGVMVILYLFVFRIAVRSLLHEARRTQDFLRLIPQTVINKSPVLKKLFTVEPALGMPRGVPLRG